MSNHNTPMPFEAVCCLRMRWLGVVACLSALYSHASAPTKIHLASQTIDIATTPSFPQCPVHLSLLRRHPSTSVHQFLLLLHHESALPRLTADVTLLHHIPPLPAYVITATATAAIAALRHADVRWIGTWKPEYKLPPALRGDDSAALRHAHPAVFVMLAPSNDAGLKRTVNWESEAAVLRPNPPFTNLSALMSALPQARHWRQRARL